MSNKLRNIIKACLPHGIVTSRHRNKFLEEYDTWKLAGKDCVEFDTSCVFKRFATIDGYGCSGSSVVMDLLREYDGCIVWATKPSFTTQKEEDCNIYGEFDLCRHTGGLLYLEYMIRPEAWVNDFWADEAVKNFIDLAYHSDVYQQHPETRSLFFHFFDNIISQRMKSDYPLMNVWQHRFTGVNDIFTLKKMTKEEYHKLCRGFLYSLFNTLFANVQENSLLVLDHIFGDCGNDMARFEPYLPGIKRIIVDRDVRAVYVHACKKNIRWIAHDSVEDFVVWERKMHYNDIENNDHDTQILKLKFEDLVLNYKEEIKKVENFLDLSQKQHIHPLKVFNPDVSVKNVFAWKEAKEFNNDCNVIKKELFEYCYT